MVSMDIDQLKQSKIGLAKMLKNGVIMDVTNVKEAIIAQNAGAAAVMALERVPADIRKEGGVARMSDPSMIKAIMEAVSIPVMAKVRIGHFVEAQILESLGVDFIDESEVLTVADRAYHIEKQKFKVPFVCGAKDSGEALRRYQEGAAMIRSKGEAGTGDISEAVYHVRKIKEQLAEVVAQCQNLDVDDPIVLEFAETCRVRPETIVEISKLGGIFPLVNFAAGGVASPADAALCMQLGCDGVFVGSGIFKSEHPEKLASAIVNSVKNYDDPALLLKNSTDLGGLMFGIQNCDLKEDEKLSSRGW